jgi:hypothetical protein
MTRKQQIASLRHALKKLILSIEKEYIRCSILTEADLQAVVIQHLKEQLRRRDSNWIIGACFSLDPYRPDVACYYAPTTYDAFVNQFILNGDCLVGVVEIKWAAPYGHDLKKMSLIQKQYDHEILAWMVFGGHSDPSIHRVNAGKEEKLQQEIDEWVQKIPATRGRTFIRCGRIIERASKTKHADKLRAIRDHWWVNDRAAKTARKSATQP